MVVCPEQLAADAGAEMLRAGGNAADAAVAAAFAQGVVNPMQCGIAGSFNGLFFDASTARSQAVVAGGRAPRAATPDMWESAGRWETQFRVAGERNRWGYQASTVPGFVRGAFAAHHRFGSGRVSWAQLIGPAVRLAAQGFEVYPYVYQAWMPQAYSNDFLSDGARTFGHSDAGRRIYLHPDGTVYRIGEVLVQEGYARTLRRVAEEGADEFYVGETARLLVEDFQRHGGLLTADDLRLFQADVEEPLSARFRDFDVVSESAPSMGPTLVEILNIVEAWDLRGLGRNTAAYVDRLARAMYLGFRDRIRWMGDPDFVAVPLARLTSKEYASALRREVESGADVFDHAFGAGATGAPGHTTHVTAVDGRGSAAAITHSLGSTSGVVTDGLGFLHNNHMIMFNPCPGLPNSIAAWKRPNNGGDPTFFLRDGELVLAIGSPAGPRKVTAIIQAVLNVCDFGMSMQDAVGAVRFHCEDQPRTLSIEPAFPPRTALDLARLGYRIEVESYGARLAAVLRDPASGRLEGGTDPRADGGLAVV